MPSRKGYDSHERAIAIRMRLRNKTARTVQKITKMSASTQNRLLRQYYVNKRIPKIVVPNRRDTLNPNAKITERYKRALYHSVKEKPELNNARRAKLLQQETGILLSTSGLQKAMARYNITRKKFSHKFVEAESQSSKDQAAAFKRFHRGVSFEQYASTDEKGISNKQKESFGYGFVERTHQNVPNIRKSLSGSSYRDFNTRIYDIVPKHESFRLNVIVTICLSKTTPVPYYEISKEYTTGPRFSAYILNRTLPKSIKYDLVDRSSVHKAVKTCEKAHIESVEEAYQHKGIHPDWIPTAHPEWNPIEQCFEHLTQHINRVSSNYNLENGWEEDLLIYEIENCLDNIPYELVKSWYRNCFCQLYPKTKVPDYLRPQPQK